MCLMLCCGDSAINHKCKNRYYFKKEKKVVGKVVTWASRRTSDLVQLQIKIKS